MHCDFVQLKSRAKKMAAAEFGIKDQLTDEKKNSITGKMAAFITSRVLSCSYLLSQLRYNMIALKKTKDTVDTVEAGLDNLVKMFNFMMRSAKQDTYGIITTVLEISKESILNIFKNGYEKQCNDMIWKMVVDASNVATVLQVLQLYRTWEAISAASNVIEDESKFKVINANLQKMESMVEKFVEICETQPEDTTIPAMERKIDKLYHSTTSKICDIRLEINGHIQELDIFSSSAAVDSVYNTVTAVAKGYQLWSTFENLSSLSKFFGVMSLGFSSILGVWNAAVFLISKEKLKELRKDVRNVNHLKETLDDLQEMMAREEGEIPLVTRENAGGQQEEKRHQRMGNPAGTEKVNWKSYTH